MPTALLPAADIERYNQTLLAAKHEALAALRRVVSNTALGDRQLSTLKVTALTIVRLPFITPYEPPAPRPPREGPTAPPPPTPTPTPTDPSPPNNSPSPPLNHFPSPTLRHYAT